MTDSTAFDVAHLANVELLTPKFDESLWFFRDLLAMRVVEQADGVAFLRTWDEYERYTIKLTASDAAGVGRTSFRAASQEALERRVAAIERSASERGGSMVKSAPARRSCSATPTGTRWRSTTRRNAMSRETRTDRR